MENEQSNNQRPPVERDPLLDVPTCRLVEELCRRPGCLRMTIEAHGRGTVGVDGPATCIVVLD